MKCEAKSFTMNGAVTKLLSESRIFRNYTIAFRKLSGLSLHLRPIEAPLLPRGGAARQKWSCAVLGQPTCGCKSCAKGFERTAGDGLSGQTMRCGCGCCGAVVPIRSGRDVVALLQVASSSKAKSSFSPAVTTKERKYRAALQLAEIFSEQLSGLCNQMLVQKQSGESQGIIRAKDFIAQHSSESISSGRVAKELHLSRSYFCNLFKKNTGLTFTEYLSRARIEHVKKLLLNQKMRVSEIAFQTGFQSLTHFNRVFRKVTGQSPTDYRQRLLTA